MKFKPNKKFRRKYRRIFKENPEAANLFLLICELTDENGEVKTDPTELATLMAARFNDPAEYAL